MVKAGINTFEGGMNKDLADRLMPANKYRDAQNFRLVTTKGSTTGNFENIKGNKLISASVVPGNIVNGNIICGVELRDEIILFVTANTTSDPISEGGASRLYKLKINLDSESQTSLTLLYDDSLNVDGSKLNWSTYYPIKAIAKYETPHVQKVYFTDGFNNMRYVNIANHLTVTGNTYSVPGDYMSIDKFEYLPKFVSSKPVLKNIVGGKINTGMVSYAYQLYIMNGAETAFSALSDPISVVSDSDFLVNTSNYKGNKEQINSGKGFTLQIDNSSNEGFNRLRLVRIEYQYLNSVPTVYICNEISIPTTGSIVNVTDVGDVLGTLTIDEFNLTSTELFSCQDIASKDNRLFVANVEEKDFVVDTWDSRAVRFRSDGIASLADSGQGVITLHNTFADWSSYTTDHDGINDFNNPNNDGLTGHQFMYQADLGTLGAEGPNIKIDFAIEEITLDSSNDDTTFYTTPPTDSNNLSYKGFASPWSGGKLSWQRDEIYRLFVVFGNDRNQLSDPRWICDLRMPSLHDLNYCDLAYVSGTDVRSLKLYPRVYFKSFPTNATTAQIYRVKRERPDRSVVVQGLAVPTVDGGNGSYYPAEMTTAISTTNGIELVKLVSPEINISKNISYQSNDYLDYVAGSEDYKYTNSSVGDFVRHIYKFRDSSYVAYSSNVKSTVSGAAIASPVLDPILGNNIIVNSKSYRNYKSTGTPAKGCTGLIVAYNNTSWSAEGNTFCIVNYKSNVYGSQYGGNTYEDRMVNASIPCSDVISTVGIWSNVSYGDTFITYFDVSTLLYDLNKTSAFHNSMSEAVYVPLESSINCTLRHDTSSQHLTFSNELSALRQEYAGSHIMVVNNGPIVSGTYTQDLDLYLYNTVYSQQLDISPAISLSVDKILETVFDTKIKSSNKKSNGEITDSWTKFGVNEFIEVDSIYGAVSSIFNFNNKLFYFQEKGFGVLSVNDRSIVQDTGSAKIVLGTGGILDRYDYVSILCGCKDKFSVIGGDTGMFWFDRVNNYIIKYSDSIDKISLSKGIQSYFTDNVATDHIVIAHPDKNNNEILYTFKDGSLDPFTLSYSENVDTFISFYSDIPNIYIPYKNRYLTTNTIHLDYIFLHDSSITPRCNFYSITGGTQHFYDSTVKVLFNQDYNSTKTFDNITYISNVIDTNGTELYNQSLSSIRCYNDYQNTDYVTLTYGTNLMHRERSWTLDVPRNVVKTVISSDPNIMMSDLTDTTRLFRERLRDKYMIADLVYTNTASKDRLVLGNVGILYRISKR